MLQHTMKVFELSVYTGESETMKETIGETLRDVLRCAEAEERLTCGLYEAGMVLETNPDAVMFCVMPMNKSGDVTLDIHYTLIEAFCLENDIRTIQVDSAEKLGDLLGNNNNNHPHKGEECSVVDMERPHLADDNDNLLLDDNLWALGGSTDYNCVLIKYADSCTEEEADMMEYHKKSCDLLPQPVIELPV